MKDKIKKKEKTKNQQYFQLKNRVIEQKITNELTYEKKIYSHFAAARLFEY